MRAVPVSRIGSYLAVVAILVLTPAFTIGAVEKAKVSVSWDKIVRVSKTRATLQVVVNPMLRRGSPIHDRAFQTLRDLRCDYVRYVPWLPYPKLGVAELDPPQDGKSSWDFSLIDPMTMDFMEAISGHAIVLNFSIIPQWMFKTEKPVPYPSDPDQVTWDYQRGTELRDPSLRELGDYYARLASWYTLGTFRDEYGKEIRSNHRYKIDYWEVLNEVDFEHQMTPEQYTACYDAIVTAIRKVAPQMRFVGLGLALPSKVPQFFEYFLNPANHRPAIPLDMISYHFYATPTVDQPPEVQQFTFFEQADKFLDIVRYIESIRQRLSPKTGTAINEIGAIAANDLLQGEPGYAFRSTPNSYWNLAAATYAYIYAELSRLGIDAAGESQLVGYPSQFPSVTMLDWNTGQPNARYWVLKLLRDNFGPGDKLVETEVERPSREMSYPPSGLYAQGFVTRAGKHKILFVNKRDRTFEISVSAAAKGQMEVVDQTTSSNSPASTQLNDDWVTLRGLAVAVVTLPD
jgi:hypothetical protein